MLLKNRVKNTQQKKTKRGKINLQNLQMVAQP